MAPSAPRADRRKATVAAVVEGGKRGENPLVIGYCGPPRRRPGAPSAGPAAVFGRVPDAHRKREVLLGVGVDGADDAVELSFVQGSQGHLSHEVDSVLQ